MEEIQYKLQSKDSVLISHAISKLLLRLKEEHKQQKDITKTAEYKLLLTTCESEDTKLATSSYRTLVLIAETGILSTALVMTNIVSNLPSVKNHSALVTAIGNLLKLEMQSCTATDRSICPYSLESHQHPFVTILAHEGSCWRSILDQIKYAMNAEDTRSASHAVVYFRPVFLYIMCNPSNSLVDGCKEEMWRLLVASEYTTKLQLDILVWLRTNDAISCVDTNRRVLEMAEMALTRKNVDLCSSLVPLIASLAIRLIEYGYDPTANFDSISTTVQWCDVITANITLNLMTELVAICPYVYLSSALKICSIITDIFECRSTFLHALLGSLLKWIAYPSVLCAKSFDAAKVLANKLSSKRAKTKEADKDNRNLARVCHADERVRFYYEMNRCTEAWSDKGLLLWLGNIRAAPANIKYKCRFILSGLVLEQESLEIVTSAIDELTEIAKSATTFASHVLCMVFYKLTKTRDFMETKHLLLALPQLLVSKENAPIVIHILDTLYNSGTPLKLLSIVLYSKAVESDPRCYRYVLRVLARALKSESSWLCRSVCAKVIRDICTSWPEHGEELVPMISQILNMSADANGSTASTLAVESVAGLCRAAVIGICSTWRVLAPKVNAETRAPVLRGLCKLFGEIPYFPVQTPEDYESLILEIVSRLWRFVFTTHDVGVARSALKALASYRLESIPLEALPAELKRSLATQGNTAAAVGGECSVVVSLPYVPGRCWIDMLRAVSAAVLPSAGDLLISFIEEELKGFHSGIYKWPQGEPQNFLYLPDRSVIRAVGERLRRHEKHAAEDVAITLECLRIFAHEYSKPLPNVKWNFLQDLAALSSLSRRRCLSIACRHAVISASAKLFVENYLSMYSDQDVPNFLLEAEEYLTLYSKLEYLCAALQPNDLTRFLAATLDHSTGSLSQSNAFDTIMQAYARALKSTGLHEENRHLLCANLQELLYKIDLQRTGARDSSYVAAMLELSTKDIERTRTSASTWREGSEVKVRNAILIEAERAIRGGTDAPLSSLAELIDVAASSSLRTRDCLLDCVGRIQWELRSNEAIASWTLDFIAHIENCMKAVPREKVDEIEFHCRVLLTCIICLSGVDRLMATERSTVLRSPDLQCRLLPQSLMILMDNQLWRNKVPQIFEWLNNMRTRSNLPRMYASAFYNALLSLKHEPHFKKAWMRCVH